MTNTNLKIAALAIMLMDHLWAFYGDMPYWFHMVGRLSAPIFLFCCVIGYNHTHNKVAYFIRLYALSLVMGLINLLPGLEGYNFARTILLTLAIIYIIDTLKCNRKRGFAFATIFIAWQVLLFLIVGLVMEGISNVGENMIMFVLSATGSVFALDGGWVFVVLGVMMYAFRTAQKKLLLSYILISLFMFITFNTHLLQQSIIRIGIISSSAGEVFAWICKQMAGVPIPLIQPGSIIASPAWMLIFALPIILLYNGKKGQGHKYLFYCFYPIHIVVLYLVSVGMLI